jgi:hypothetical protein
MDCRERKLKRALEKIKAALAGGQAAFQNTTNNNAKHTENDAATQRMRLLEALRQGSVSTPEARSKLDVFAPAPRIFELRAKGYRIDTVMVPIETAYGKVRKVALYVLLGDEPTEACQETSAAK